MNRFRALVPIGLLVSGQALADTPGYFAGVGIGYAQIDEDETHSVFFVPGQNLEDRVDLRSI
jgi:hypothetical protein